MMADNDELRQRIRELEARNAALEAQLHEGGQMYHHAVERTRKLESLMCDMYEISQRLYACVSAANDLKEMRDHLRKLGIEVD